jgi:hypothetical protein
MTPLYASEYCGPEAFPIGMICAKLFQLIRTAAIKTSTNLFFINVVNQLKIDLSKKRSSGSTVVAILAAGNRKQREGNTRQTDREKST